MDNGYWNYRVIRRENKADSETYYGIYEVYYNQDATIESWTVDRCSPFGESLAELLNDISHMIKALDKPILEEKEIDGVEKLVEVETDG